jgi:hypothetical protein
MGTYLEIQTYVANKYGWKPKTCWIAHAKELGGLEVPPAPNRKGKERMNPCPPDKLPAIREALEHFGMVKK